MSLLAVENLTVSYLSRGGAFPALRNFSCRVAAGDTVGVIGESGAGKTTLALALLGLLGDRAVIESGSIVFGGTELTKLTAGEWRKYRGGRLALIPQASQNIWNPVLTVGHQLAEHIEHHLGISRSDAVRQAAAALREMGLEETVLASYPHQLSGGMRQRAAIAAACAVNPACIIADECTNSLDVRYQNDVLQALENLRQARGTAMVVISHDLAVIARLCRKTYVLLAGETVEAGLTADILRSPVHPYARRMVADTCSFLASLPAAGKEV
ncbi:ATP-binding cassette domain-containing protein [Anaeroselena agilis]|uniref:Nickel import system ATP-binding protein NikD n=1 Tax=Anaeroselena agilis TaxID=3063788 RepID=A0ABU3NZE9_9FIRM|nr:ABC transporter ATP-binding protein [Selenomonadales bacterium 4137-cl]